MTYVLIRHLVTDFAHWKPAYDAHLPAREKAGLIERNLLRNIDNPDEVVLLFAVDDLEKARAFIESPELREAMQQAGVIDKPEIVFLS